MAEPEAKRPIKIKPRKTKRKVRYRKKKSPWPTIVGLLGLTAFVGLFGGLVYYVRQKQSETAALQKQDETRAQPAPRTSSRRPTVGASMPTDQLRVPELEDLSLEMPSLQPNSIPSESDPAPVDPIRQLVAALDQSGELCQTFQFLPENELQYEQLQTFARQLSRAKTFLGDSQERETDLNERKFLSERSVHWLQAMKALVTQVVADAPERLPRINALAKSEFEKGSDQANPQVVFYGFVFLRNKEEGNLVVKFDRKQVYFSLPNVGDFGRTSDESYRVFFVESPEAPSQKRMHSPGGGLIKVSSAKSIYTFDPMDSED